MGKYKTLLLNVGLFALNSVATKLISFFLVPLYTTYMSAGEYGLTDMANTVISLILPLVTLDIADAAVRYIVGEKENRDKYAAISFSITGISVLIVALFSPLLDLGIFGGLGEFKVWFTVDYAAVAFMTLFGEISRGAGSIRIIPLCAGVASVVTLASAVALIAGSGLGIYGYFISVSIGPTVAILIYLTVGGLGSMILRGFQELAIGGLSLVRRISTPMIRYALPLIPNSLFWWMSTSINRFFITGMIGIAASGLFAAAGKIPSLINTCYGIFQQAWQLSVFEESDDRGIAGFYSTVFRIVSSGLTILCALITLSAPLLASAILKGETYDAWPMIPILLIANLFNVFNAFYGTVYTSTLNTGFIMRTTIFGALSCIVCTPLFILMMGTYGACIASIVGQGVVLVLRASDSKKYIPFDAGWKTLIPIILILCIQSLVTAMQLPCWIIVSLCCAILVLIVQGYRLFNSFPIFRAVFKK